MSRILGEKVMGKVNLSMLMASRQDNYKWKQVVRLINNHRVQKRDLCGIIFKYIDMDGVSRDKVWAVKIRGL